MIQDSLGGWPRPNISLGRWSRQDHFYLVDARDSDSEQDFKEAERQTTLKVYVWVTHNFVYTVIKLSSLLKTWIVNNTFLQYVNRWRPSCDINTKDY